MRKAMSPVPPATSRMRWGVGGVEAEWPGFRDDTKWSLRRMSVRTGIEVGIERRRGNKTYFQTRCQPKDIRSFMRSYDSATLWKTPATRSVFSDSESPSSKPKCVVRV